VCRGCFNAILQRETENSRTPTDEERAWEIFCTYRDQDFSFVDCASFAAMERIKLSTAFTFDRHYSVMKYAVVPGKEIK